MQENNFYAIDTCLPSCSFLTAKLKKDFFLLLLQTVMYKSFDMNVNSQ